MRTLEGENGSEGGWEGGVNIMKDEAFVREEMVKFDVCWIVHHCDN